MKQVYKKKLLTDLHCHSPLVCATHCHYQWLRNIHYTQAENTSTLFIFFYTIFFFKTYFDIFFPYFFHFVSTGRGIDMEGWVNGFDFTTVFVWSSLFESFNTTFFQGLDFFVSPTKTMRVRKQREREREQKKKHFIA